MSDHTKHPAAPRGGSVMSQDDLPKGRSSNSPPSVCDPRAEVAVRILEACGRAPGLFERLSPELSAAVNATLLNHLSPPPTT